MKYFITWFVIQACQLILVWKIQQGHLEQHDYTDSKLIPLVFIICWAIHDIRKDIKNNKIS